MLIVSLPVSLLGHCSTWPNLALIYNTLWLPFNKSCVEAIASLSSLFLSRGLGMPAVWKHSISILQQSRKLHSQLSSAQFPSVYSTFSPPPPTLFSFSFYRSFSFEGARLKWTGRRTCLCSQKLKIMKMDRKGYCLHVIRPRADYHSGLNKSIILMADGAQGVWSRGLLTQWKLLLRFAKLHRDLALQVRKNEHITQQRTLQQWGSHTIITVSNWK